MKTFTDDQLAKFQLKLTRDYNELKATQTQLNLPFDWICVNLKLRVDSNFTDISSDWYNFEESDKLKVYTVLTAYITALRNAQSPNSSRFYMSKYHPVPYEPQYAYSREHHCYCPANDIMFNWLLLDLLTSPCHSSRHPTFGNHSHGHSPSTNKNGDAFALFLTIILAAAALFLTFIALYYLFSQTMNSLERFFWNEGWLQAAVTLASAVASGFAAGLLTTILLSAPLASLALAAGIGPAGLVIFGIVCLSIIGAGAGCFITNQIQQYVLRKNNPHALDPDDPHRFTLTKDEEDNLETQGLDPTIVKSLIALLRKQMGKEQVPDLFTRLFTSSGKDKHRLLHTIRELRRGELTTLTIETNQTQLTYNLRPFPPEYLKWQLPQFNGAVPPYAPENFSSPFPPPYYPTPSAPEYDGACNNTIGFVP